MTLTEMQTTLLTALGAEKWKQVRGVNQGLPILQWQTADGPAASVTLAVTVVCHLANPIPTAEAAITPHSSSAAAPVFFPFRIV